MIIEGEGKLRVFSVMYSFGLYNSTGKVIGCRMEKRGWRVIKQISSFPSEISRD